MVANRLAWGRMTGSAARRLPFAGQACDTASQMDMPLTLGLGAALAALAAFAGWRGARAPDPHKGPRLMPWRFIMLAAAACLVFVLGHLVQMLTSAGQS